MQDLGGWPQDIPKPPVREIYFAAFFNLLNASITAGSVYGSEHCYTGHTGMVADTITIPGGNLNNCLYFTGFFPGLVDRGQQGWIDIDVLDGGRLILVQPVYNNRSGYYEMMDQKDWIEGRRAFKVLQRELETIKFDRLEEARIAREEMEEKKEANDNNTNENAEEQFQMAKQQIYDHQDGATPGGPVQSDKKKKSKKHSKAKPQPNYQQIYNQK
jgi:hypothetical protein